MTAHSWKDLKPVLLCPNAEKVEWSRVRRKAGPSSRNQRLLSRRENETLACVISLSDRFS